MSEIKPRKTGVLCSKKFKEHQTGEGHPDSPARIGAVERALKAPSLSGILHSLQPRPALREEVLLVHTDRLYDEILATRRQERTYLDDDTVTSPESADVALLAAGSVLVAVDAVLEGRVDNAFALVRPPGHHAKPDKAMGFCLFNNVAIAAQYALRKQGLERVLILDFDLHHGNGTQKAFYTSPEVLYTSSHQFPYYPGTGAVEETGKDAGEGFTLNVPMPPGMGDAGYVQIYRDIFVPVGKEFDPHMILVSAGFDTHEQDPMGGMRVTQAGFAALAGEILSLADAACGGKVVFALEGGYNLAGLERSLVSVLEVMSAVHEGSQRFEASEPAEELIESVRQVHGKFWKCLAS